MNADAVTETASPAVEERPVVPAWRLVLTLAVAGALAGLLLVVVHNATDPLIRKNRLAAEKKAAGEVLAGAVAFDTLFIQDGGIVHVEKGKVVAEPPATVGGSFERVFRGYDADGKPLGYAIVAAESGFADIINLIFGYDPSGPTILGMKVLKNKETPGLGDKIVKDTSFVGEFAGATPAITEGGPPAIEGVKQGLGGDDRTKIDTITGATISSDAVIQIINNAMKRMHPILVDYRGDDEEAGQ